MFTTSLINLAVLAYFSVSSGFRINFDTDNGFNIHVVQDPALQCDRLPGDWPGPRHSADFTIWSNCNVSLEQKSATKVEEKVVLRESPLSEKCGLGLETVARPDEEIVTLQSRASGLKSALALGEQIAKQTTEKAPFTDQWKKKFDMVWDEEGGFYLDRTYHPFKPVSRVLEFAFPVAPASDRDPILCPISGDFQCGWPIGCRPLSPVEPERR